MTVLPPDPIASRAMDGYLTAVAARLTGPGRVREAILAELRDGLLDAFAARLAGGATPAQAVAAATAEFGEPAAVAGGFASELAAATARRVALTLASTGPLIGLLWLAAYAAGRFGPVRGAPPWRWHGTLPGAWLAFPLLCGAVAIAGLAALLVPVLDRWPGRRLRWPRRSAWRGWCWPDGPHAAARSLEAPPPDRPASLERAGRDRRPLPTTASWFIAD